MGEGPIDWREVEAWQALTLIDLLPWEARAIRQMSAAFVSQRYDARKPDCPAPYNGAAKEVVDGRDRVADQFRALKGAFASMKKRG